MSQSQFKNFKEAVETSALIVSLLFLVEAADMILQRGQRLTLTGLGIVPRTVAGLAGIAFSPLLHASPAHLLANALPLFVLLVLLFWDRHYYPALTLASIWFFSGLGTWLIGRASEGGRPIIHIEQPFHPNPAKPLPQTNSRSASAPRLVGSSMRSTRPYTLNPERHAALCPKR